MVNGLILFAHIEGYSMFTVLLNSCNPKVNYRIMKKMCWLYLFAIIALVFYGCLTLRYEFLFVWPICVLMPTACDYLSAVHMKKRNRPKNHHTGCPQRIFTFCSLCSWFVPLSGFFLFEVQSFEIHWNINR